MDLANFLNSMGANIMGAGTDVIKIRGVKQLRGGAYSIIPDQIEAGTYMAAVAAAGGDVLIQNVIPKHLDCITAKLVEMGVEVEELDDAVRVRRSGPISRTNVKTMPYPGFPSVWPTAPASSPRGCGTADTAMWMSSAAWGPTSR